MAFLKPKPKPKPAPVASTLPKIVPAFDSSKLGQAAKGQGMSIDPAKANALKKDTTPAPAVNNPMGFSYRPEDVTNKGDVMKVVGSREQNRTAEVAWFNEIQKRQGIEQEAQQQQQQEARMQGATQQGIEGATEITTQADRPAVNLMGIKIKDPRLKSLLASARPNSVIGIMSRLSGNEKGKNPFMDDPEIYESALKTEIEKEVYNQRFTAIQNVGLVKEYFADLAGFDTGSLAAGAGGAGFFYGLIPDSGVASKFAQAKTDVSEAKQVIADINKELNAGNMTPDQAQPLFQEALEQGYRGQASYKKYSNYGFKFAKNKDMADPINTDLRQLEIDIRQSASKWGFEI